MAHFTDLWKFTVLFVLQCNRIYNVQYIFHQCNSLPTNEVYHCFEAFSFYLLYQKGVDLTVIF